MDNGLMKCPLLTDSKFLTDSHLVNNRNITMTIRWMNIKRITTNKRRTKCTDG